MDAELVNKITVLRDEPNEVIIAKGDRMAHVVLGVATELDVELVVVSELVSQDGKAGISNHVLQ